LQLHEDTPDSSIISFLYKISKAGLIVRAVDTVGKQLLTDRFNEILMCTSDCTTGSQTPE
jgi:hypothetical protein